MPSSIPLYCLVFATVGLACGSTDTSLGRTQEPINAVPCLQVGEHRGACRCASDGRWLCAGQNSVTCSDLYGRGGGRLLVDVDMGCEMKWSRCSDGRVYGLLCDGLRCTCTVNGEGDIAFLTPRCAEMAEANTACGWSLQFPMGASGGSGPVQGMPCTPVGASDTTFGTGCECTQSGWDCPTSLGCRLAASWSAVASEPAGKRFVVDADGTFFFADDASSTPEAIESGHASGFVGTWLVANKTLRVRSAHVPAEPACEAKVGDYAPTFASDCRTLDLHVVSDTCAARTSILDGLRATR